MHCNETFKFLKFIDIVNVMDAFSESYVWVQNSLVPTLYAHKVH